MDVYALVVVVVILDYQSSRFDKNKNKNKTIMTLIGPPSSSCHYPVSLDEDEVLRHDDY